MSGLSNATRSLYSKHGWCIWNLIPPDIYLQSRELITWLEAHHSELEKSGHGVAIKTNKVHGQESLVALVSETATDSNIEVDRLEPTGKNIKVWVKSTGFADLIRWLNSLTNEYGTTTQEALIDSPLGDGLVTAQLELRRRVE